MPMIDLTMPEDALSEDALDGLSDSLMRALLRSERVSEGVAARKSIAWFFVHELPAERMYGGGRRLTGRGPHFRVDIGVPEGALDTARRNEFVADATRLILEAAGQDPDEPAAAAYVWILFREVSEGCWGAGGRILGLADIGRIVGANETRGAAAEPVG